MKVKDQVNEEPGQMMIKPASAAWHFLSWNDLAHFFTFSQPHLLCNHWFTRYNLTCHLNPHWMPLYYKGPVLKTLWHWRLGCSVHTSESVEEWLVACFWPMEPETDKKCFCPPIPWGDNLEKYFLKLFGKSLWMEEQLSFPSLFHVLNLLSSSLRSHS